MSSIFEYTASENNIEVTKLQNDCQFKNKLL